MSERLSERIRSGDHPFYGLGPTMTEEQLAMIDACESKRILFLDSVAGGGKTTIATAIAHYLHHTYPKRYKEVRYIFSPVSERVMGYRPGAQQTKEMDYLQPLKDALTEINEIPARSLILIDEQGEELGTGGWIKAASHTFMRGINLPDSINIIDEAQNFTKSELKKVLTRVHDSSLTIVIGHSGQVDLPNKEHSALAPYKEHFRLHPLAWVGQFSKNFRGEISQWADKLG